MDYTYVGDLPKGISCMQLDQEGGMKHSIYAVKHVKDHVSHSERV